MKTLSPFSLKQTNSFAVETIAPIAYFPRSIDDLTELATLSLDNFYILGEGYNTLFVESSSPIIVKPEFQGIEIEEQESATIVRVAASENWHDFVCFCIEHGINGLENLALIPGSVGAAPVQNIGAYGVEMAKYCQKVLWFDFEEKKLVTYQHEDCQFSYRESIFKHTLKNKGLITGVVFSFPKKWQATLSYAGLDHLASNASAKEVMQAVIDVRQSKLPNPEHIPNAGSFFKNPVIDNVQWQELIEQYPNMPSYPQENGKTKVAAGWLIEQTGLKGYTSNGAGVHSKQALVIVNHNATQGKTIADLALYIKSKVNSLFGIDLEPEVRAVFSQGEGNLLEHQNG